VMQAIQCPGVNHEEAFDVENPEANVAVKKKKKSGPSGRLLDSFNWVAIYLGFCNILCFKGYLLCQHTLSARCS